MTKRVVSKRTKLLFIGFGATSIATASIVAATDLAIQESRAKSPIVLAHPPVPAQPTK